MNGIVNERPGQLVADVLELLPRQRGQATRVDYEYERRGMFNAFLRFQPLAGWRTVKVTHRRTKHNFAHLMRDLVDVHFPHAEKLRVDVLQARTKLGRLYHQLPLW